MSVSIRQLVHTRSDLLTLAGLPLDPSDRRWVVTALALGFDPPAAAALLEALWVGPAGDGVGFCFDVRIYHRYEALAQHVLWEIGGRLRSQGLDVHGGPLQGPRFPGMRAPAYCFIASGDVDLAPTFNRGPTPEA